MHLAGLLKPARFAGELGFAAGARVGAGFAAAIMLIACLVFGLSACGSDDNGEKLGERVIPLGQPVPKGGGAYQVGKPYQIAGLWYTPREDPGYDRVGSASWYGELFHGRRTANGEIYDMDRLSAAHPTLPLPVYARVTNLNNGRSVVVRINDRGPYSRDRIIDLSRRSAELLGFRSNGTATVRVKYLRRAPLSGDDSYERSYVASQSWMQYAANGTSPKGGEGKAALPADPVQRGWRATTKAAELPAPQSTGSIPRAAETKTKTGLAVQAASFKNKENADRASTALSAIAPVEVAPIDVGSDVYFRVRLGPFSAASEAEAALVKVRDAGFRGAKIVTPN